jgi:hypothetical protein
MRQGRSIVELAQEIQRQSESKIDYIADTPAMRMLPQAAMDPEECEPGSLDLAWGNGDEIRMPVTALAHRQIASRFNVPAKFYDRMLNDHPDLLAHAMTGLMEREPQKRMVRTLDGQVRAFLSERFRPLDNAELFEAVFPVLQDLGVKVVSAEVTERRMYLKFLAPSVKVDAPDLLPPNRRDPHGDQIEGGMMRSGDFAGHSASEIIAGGVISNSEVGQGSLRVEQLRFFVRCLNGWVDATVTRRNHVGRSTAIEGVEAAEFLKDSTRRLQDAALFSALKDTVTGMFQLASLEGWVDRARAAKADAVPAILAPAVVQVVSNRLALPDVQRKGVLESLIQDGDLSRWGVSNAITALSQKVEDYDTASDLEAEGGKVVAMPKSDWAGVMQEAQRLYDNPRAA